MQTDAVLDKNPTVLRKTNISLFHKQSFPCAVTLRDRAISVWDRTVTPVTACRAYTHLEDTNKKIGERYREGGGLCLETKSGKGEAGKEYQGMNQHIKSHTPPDYGLGFDRASCAYDTTVIQNHAQPEPTFRLFFCQVGFRCDPSQGVQAYNVLHESPKYKAQSRPAIARSDFWFQKKSLFP